MFASIDQPHTFHPSPWSYCVNTEGVDILIQADRRETTPHRVFQSSLTPKTLNMDQQPDEPSHYCIDGLVHFQNTFVKSHSLLSLVLCLSGTIGNSLVVYILTRHQMRSPINILFASRSFVHLLVNVMYIPCVFGVFLPGLFGTSNNVIKFVPVLDMIAVWSSVTVAAWSYIAVLHPPRYRLLCSTTRTIVVIVCACVVCPLVCMPMYFTYCVKGYVATEEDYGTGSEEIHVVAPPPSVTDVDDKVLVDVIEWFYGVVLKVVPCAVVGVISLEIWSRLIKSSQQRGDIIYTKVGSNMEAIHPSNTSTNMLLVFFVIFIVYELTEGIINLFSFVLGETFAYKSHTFLFEVLDLLNFLNRNVVFILFCAMSVQFRTVVVFILKPKNLSYLRRFSNDLDEVQTSSFKSS